MTSKCIGANRGGRGQDTKYYNQKYYETAFYNTNKIVISFVIRDTSFVIRGQPTPLLESPSYS